MMRIIFHNEEIIMLVIKAIKLAIPKSRRIRTLNRVRIGYQSSFAQSAKQPRLMEGKILEWREDMTLPIFFNKDLEIQFYPKHEFGYNPEQLQSVCTASVRIYDFKKEVQEGEVKDAKGVKIGKFQIEFKIYNTTKGAKDSIENTKGQIIVSSLLAHFNNTPGDNGFLQLQIGDEKVMTPLLDFIAGELLWVEKMKIPVYKLLIEEGKMEQSLTIRIIVDGEEMAEAFINLKEVKGVHEKFKRIPITSLFDNEECGVLFIDLLYKQKMGKKKNISHRPGITEEKTHLKLPTISSSHKNLNPNIIKRQSKSEAKIIFNDNEESSMRDENTSHSILNKKTLKKAKESSKTGQKYSSNAKKLLLFKMGENNNVQDEHPLYSRLRQK